MLQRELCARIADTLANCPIHDHLGYEALSLLKLPGPDYRALLSVLHHTLAPKLYVEIGVREGHSLRLALPQTKCIGIDPQPSLPELPSNAMLAITTSDNFFASEGQRERARGFDLALIDGDHSFEQALRDFSNLEKLAKPSSVIAIHDVIPMDARTSQPTPGSVSFWTGDVWRLMGLIRSWRPNLTVFTVACPPTGLGIVGNFDGKSFDQDDGEIIRVARDVPFPADWDEQVRMLNIVDNNPGAILAAFNGKAAA